MLNSVSNSTELSNENDNHVFRVPHTKMISSESETTVVIKGGKCYINFVFPKMNILEFCLVILTKWFFIITLNNHCVVLLKCGRWINPFHATVLLLYLSESIRKSLVFWCLQGVKKETSGRNWINSNRSTVFNWGKQQNVKGLTKD